MVFAARLRRSTGDGPVPAPPLSRGCGSRPRTLRTSRVRRPPSARREGCGATGRRLRPAVTDSGAASRSVPSRTPTPAAAAGLCRCGAGTRCPADTTGPAPAAGPATSLARAAAAARSMPTSRRPRSTAEYSHATNGRIDLPVTPDQRISTRSCYEFLAWRLTYIPSPPGEGGDPFDNWRFHHPDPFSHPGRPVPRTLPGGDDK